MAHVIWLIINWETTDAINNDIQLTTAGTGPLIISSRFPFFRCCRNIFLEDNQQNIVFRNGVYFSIKIEGMF